MKLDYPRDVWFRRVQELAPAEAIPLLQACFRERPFPALYDHDTAFEARTAGGELIGCVMFDLGDETCTLKWLAVHPAYQRGGVARRLLITALAELDAPIELTMNPPTEAALALYKSFGFEVQDGS